MIRVTNCILINNESILLLKKPRRGWYAFPGGKMEQGETVQEAVIREFKEETGLKIFMPKLTGVFTFLVKESKKVVKEWIMFTFLAHSFDGQIVEHSEEGELEWIPLEDVKNLPMAKGDYKIFDSAIHAKSIVYGAFTYTADEVLIDWRLNP